MAYGLPTRGQADWDDELNNSVEALRSDVQTATADATVARSNSTQAISIAQDAAARVEEVSGLTGEDDAIALLQADDDSATAVATDARVETKVAADVANDASPIGAALSSTIGTAITGPNQGGLPSYAGVRTHSWDASLSLYNGESPSLRTFRAGLRDALRNTGAYRITCVGDSKTFGSGLAPTAHVGADSYPAQLRDLLGAASGRVFANLSDKRWSANTGFNQAAWAGSQPGTNYLEKPAVGAGSITFTTLTPCTGVKLYAYSMNGASNATVSVTIDGGAPASWTVFSGSPWRTTSYTGLANTTHTVTIATSDKLALLGIEHLYSSNKVVVDNAGRASASSESWEPSLWVHLWHSTFVAPAPTSDATIMNLGTNADSDTLANLEVVATNLVGLGKPLLLIVPGGLGTDRDARKTKLYDIADSLDLPLLDFQTVIGDTTVADAAGLMEDSATPIHESVRGYSLEAAAVARSILM